MFKAATPFLLQRVRAFSTSNLSMPVLEATIARHEVAKPLKGCAILCIQHSLKTMLPAIEGLIRLGAEDVFVMGKQYSESNEVAEQLAKTPNVHYRRQAEQAALGQFIPTLQRNAALLWEDLESSKKSGIKKILVLDHGGYATQMIPSFRTMPVVTIEKTTAGISREDASYLPVPRIELATAAIKRVLESPIIAMGITRKLSQKLLPEIFNSRLACGVIGYGAIGAAITQHLLSLGHEVFVYDTDQSKLNNLPKGAHRVINLSFALMYSDIVFGCTGKDISIEPEAFSLLPKNQILISCSSDDIEFRRLLRLIQLLKGEQITSPFSNIEYQNTRGATIKIVRGGFPANFDNDSESEPPEYIQLTRSLLIAASVQAARYSGPTNRHSSLMLDPQEQLLIARDFLKFLQDHALDYPQLEEFDKLFSRPDARCLEWIAQRSGGSPDPSVEAYSALTL